MVITLDVFSFFMIFSFIGLLGGGGGGVVKRQKMAQDDKNILSVALHISGTIYHMIAIYGTLK